MPSVSASSSTSAGYRPQHDVVATLRECVAGDVLLPDSPGYDDARHGFNLLVDPRPAVVVVAETRFDVVEAVRFAHREDLRVAVMATGHGQGPSSDGALLINTSRLTEVDVDAQAATARIAAGATWADVLTRTQPHRLSALVGSSTGVGAVGYTLGGGFGWLARKFGLASDRVRSFEVVTPDGQVVTASTAKNAELFWALRGGGAGSLGVVTSMEIDLTPVGSVYGGNLFYPADDAVEVIRRFRDWAPHQSEELTSAVTLMNFPPLPEIPEPLRGNSFVIIRGAWSGVPDVGRDIVNEWRRWRAPVADTWAEMPFDAIDSISMDPTDPVAAMISTEWIDDVTDDVVDALIDRIYPTPGDPAIVTFGELRHGGGAVERNVAASPTDLGRTGTFLLELVAMIPDPHAALVVESKLQLVRDSVAAHVTGATYPNFVHGDDLSSRSASAFSDDNRAKISALKLELDPTNRFCHGMGLI